jgi:hypothetical protein
VQTLPALVDAATGTVEYFDMPTVREIVDASRRMV